MIMEERRILLVEDEQKIADTLKFGLTENGYETDVAYDGSIGLKLFQANLYNLVVLDINLPGKNGYELCRIMRQHNADLPIIMLTALSTLNDKIEGYDSGADDYIIKPFDADELVLRVKNILKRSSLKTPEPESYEIGLYRFYPKELLLIGPSDRKILTERESQLLLLLRKNLGQLVRKRDILDQLWHGSDFFTGRSLDVFVSRLRKYLSEDARIEIESIRSAGLRLVVQEYNT